MSIHILWIGAVDLGINLFLNCFFWSIMMPVISNFSVTVQQWVAEYGMIHVIWAATLFTVLAPCLFLHFDFVQSMMMNGTRAEGADKERLDRIFGIVCKAADADASKYLLYIIEDGAINALAMGKRRIAVHRGAMVKCHDDELAGLLAHELGHLRRKHTPFGMFQVGVQWFTRYILLFFYSCKWFLGAISVIPFIGWIFLWISYALYVVYYGICWFWRFPYFYLGSFYSRRIEYDADAFAVNIGLGECIYRGLCKIAVENMNNPHPRLEVDGWDWVTWKLGSDHPDLDNRIKRVKENCIKWREKNNYSDSDGTEGSPFEMTSAEQTTEKESGCEQAPGSEEKLNVPQEISEVSGDGDSEKEEIKDGDRCPFCGERLYSRVDKRGNTYLICGNSRYWHLGGAYCDFRKYPKKGGDRTK